MSPGHAAQGDWHGGIRSRIQESKQKIDQGIQRGTLNRHEARKLNKELSKILNKIDRMKSDGRLSQGEREKINRDLDRLDRAFQRKACENRRREMTRSSTGNRQGFRMKVNRIQKRPIAASCYYAPAAPHGCVPAPLGRRPKECVIKKARVSPGLSVSAEELLDSHP